MAYFCVPTSRLSRVGLWAVALGLLALSVAGCVRLLEPRTSDATYYLLDAAQHAGPATTDSTGLAVGLRQPRLASYLSDTRLVTRRGPHTLRFSEFHRWAEELPQGINRTVALALARRPGIRQVETVPWSQNATFDYVVQLHVLAFEGVGPPPAPEADEDAPPPEGSSQMSVQWTIVSPDADTVLARGHTQTQTEEWSVGDYEALTARLGRSLDTLAADVGTRLKALDRR